MPRLTALLAALLMLSACETVKGAGKDLESAGSTISREAEKVQRQF
ncbi:entericidin A/B family lipoprotein [Pseudoruegeria sp. SHC-113]|nr:entericidin A/B family lipoprotein [Pseudoruegeria sp. SHC-113]MCT8159162.1 entericidin A/B family lipoprotein [Pseudoruegeria sp. SHC-113]